jgi:pyrimidine-specific ribonucleoside hydrolase
MPNGGIAVAATPLIIDTDPGVDDAFAIALAAASPEVDLRAVTTVFGNVGIEQTTSNALRLLALCDRKDVPVAQGADRPLVYPHPFRATYVHGSDGLSGRRELLPMPSRGLDPADAVDLMALVLRTTEQPVTIAAIGPLTNIALLLATHPGLKPAIGRLVVMGGALDGGNVTARAEFNVWSDPEAARRVLTEEDLPTVLVPMDLTMRCAVDKDWLAQLEVAGPVGSTLVSLTPIYLDHYRRVLGREALVLHDAVALAEAVRPGILGCTPLPLDVECSLGPARGVVLADRRVISLDEPPTGRPVELALDTDLAELHRFLLDRLGR